MTVRGWARRVFGVTKETARVRAVTHNPSGYIQIELAKPGPNGVDRPVFFEIEMTPDEATGFLRMLSNEIKEVGGGT